MFFMAQEEVSRSQSDAPATKMTQFGKKVQNHPKIVTFFMASDSCYIGIKQLYFR